MPQIKRYTFTNKLYELIDNGVFTPTSKDPYNYDAGMNFIGVLGVVPNHQLYNRDVIITCTWNGNVTRPLHYQSGRPYSPNLLYDYNGSGQHCLNNDPRYILPTGSKGLELNYIEFLNKESELEFWKTRESFIKKLSLYFIQKIIY